MAPRCVLYPWFHALLLSTYPTSNMLSLRLCSLSLPSVTGQVPRRRIGGGPRGGLPRGSERTELSGLCRRAFSDDGNDADVELAVFRFTLGIPGFDDALIPRVAGFVGVALLLLNHALSGSPSPSQTVTETVGLALAAVGIAAPTLQKRIEEATPGKGRRPAVEDLEGASNAFAIAEQLTQEQRQEAAWASFAIIKNANVCGIFISVRDTPVLCRGALGVGIGAGEACLVGAQAAYTRTALGADASEYFENRGRIDASPLCNCEIVPSGAGSVAVLPIAPLDGGAPSAGSMVLVCDRERAMSPKEMAWCRSVASKLHSVLIG